MVIIFLLPNHSKSIFSIHLRASYTLLKMKSQILLALLPFVPVALANASDSWNSVCGKTPKADTTIDGQKFQYICHERHSGTVSKEIGDFNHPDDCARLIVSRPEEQIVWMVKNGNGQCRILQQGGNTKPWTKNDILVLKKTEDTDEDLDADEDPAVELQKCKAELQKCRAGSCGSDSSSGSSSGSSSDSSSTATPECMSLLHYTI